MLPVYQQRNFYNNSNNNMAEVNKSKLQLRSGLPIINGDKTPSPATKLLINHGKPNFTIQRSPKAQNGNSNPLSPTPKTTTRDEFVVKSTKFNGVFKPSNISTVTKEILKQNGSYNTTNGNDNEAAKVVLRRTKFAQPELREGEDENVPEFILRQRRIQERLANQNILDFENRRSGYFTQVMISPTNPNRQSFVETMASPAIKPGLEMPPPAEEEQHNDEQLKQEQHVEPVVLNGQIKEEQEEQKEEEEEEEVAKAIEEVNKAVEGEDDDKIEEEEEGEQLDHNQEQNEQNIEAMVVVAVTASENEVKAKETSEVKAITETAEEVVTAVVTSALEVTQVEQHQQDTEVQEMSKELKMNGTVEEHLQNGHSNGEVKANEITISHTNGLNGSINFEPKTVVSFSQELGNDINKYPDTVKVLKEGENSEVDSELKELAKLKFEIKADDKDIEVKPVLITEETVSN